MSRDYGNFYHPYGVEYALPVSSRMAGSLAKKAGVSKPRIGYEVVIAKAAQTRGGWTHAPSLMLENRSGSFFVYNTAIKRAAWKKVFGVKIKGAEGDDGTKKSLAFAREQLKENPSMNVKFKDLLAGDTFDFIDPDSRQNSFYKRVMKISPRGYIDKSGSRYNVGSTGAKVFNVVARAGQMPVKHFIAEFTGPPTARVDAGDYEDREFSPVQHEMNRVSRRKNNPVENRDNAYQAIVTKYIPASNTRGSRVKATTASGISLTVSYDSGLNSYENHVAAAEALQNKMKWGGDMVGGATKDGYAFTFRDVVKRNPAPKSRMSSPLKSYIGISKLHGRPQLLHSGLGHPALSSYWTANYDDFSGPYTLKEARKKLTEMQRAAKRNPAPLSTRKKRGIAKLKRMAQGYADETGVSFVVTKSGEIHPASGHKYSDEVASVKPRAKNPAPRNSGFAIYARKGNGPRMFYDGFKFSNNGNEKRILTATAATKRARELIAEFPILRGYTVTVEPRRHFRGK